MYEIKHCNGHVVVTYDGRFLFSADTISEAQQEIEIRELEDALLQRLDVR